MGRRFLAVLPLTLLVICLSAGTVRAGVTDLPLRPVALGEAVTYTNALCSVTMASNSFLYFRDFQILYMWATVTNLSGVEDRFRIAPTTDTPAGWMPPRGEGEFIRLGAGETGEIKFICKAEYEGQVGAEDIVSAIFNYRVSSLNNPETYLDFAFSVTVHPQMAYSNYSDYLAAVGGSVIDAVTGEPISGAEVSLMLGETTRLVPFDMVAQTASDGTFELSCWDINLVNSHHSPYFAVPGYYLIIQRQGYETYVSPVPLTPVNGQPIEATFGLTPLTDTSSYAQRFSTALSYPGVFEIVVNPGWTRFAAALGKHPDADDPELMPTVMPYLDSLGNILWSRELTDESWGVDLSEDDSMVGCAYNGGHVVWDTSGNELWRQTMPEGSPTHPIEIKFSPDSSYVVSGPGTTNDFIVYQARTGVPAWQGYLDGAVVRSILFPPDGMDVVIGGHPRRFTSTGTRTWKSYITYSPYMLVASSDGGRILAADKGDTVTMFNSDGAIQWRHEHKVITFGDMSADGSVVAVLTSHGYLFCYNGDGEIQWYRRIVGGVVNGQANISGAGHNGLDVSEDGSYILVGGGNFWTILYNASGNIVWQDQGPAAIDYEEHPLRHSVMSVKISGDNTKIAAGYGYSDPRLVYYERLPEQNGQQGAYGP